MNKDQEPIPFPADDSNGTSKHSPQSPWLFHLGPYYFAKKTKNGNPSVIAATGFVQLSERVFFKHKIRKGDIVQIRSGWDDAYKACFAEVDKIFLENLDLKMPAPAKGGTVIIKLRNVPAGAVIRVGKSPTNIKGTRRRNPRKMLAKGK